MIRPTTAGERIEELLEKLAATGESPVRGLAEELLRAVSDLYGSGLARIVEIVAHVAPEALSELVADDLVSGLLSLHDLHPEDLSVRIMAALDSVRPMLAQHGGDVELLGIDEEAGAVHLRLLGSCDGCPSSSATLTGAIEVALAQHAPEIVILDVEEPEAAESPGTPILLGTKPVYGTCPTEGGNASVRESVS
ncbi:MAG: NifU family protein [Actinomycetota bacterium]|nr:NifU family protein [Actinomycetota bacterium]